MILRFIKEAEFSDILRARGGPDQKTLIMAIMLTLLTCKISKISNLVFGGVFPTCRARLLRSPNDLFSMTYNIFKKLNVFLSPAGAVCGKGFRYR